MAKKINVADIVRRFGVTLIFPVVLFFVMWIICAANGKNDVYINSALFRYLIRDASITAIIALGIFSQFRCGRFDFSGGATMILSAIISANLAKLWGLNGFLFVVVAVVCSMALSVLTGLIYILARVPIIIITIAITLLYESLTYIIFGGNQVNVLGQPFTDIGVYPLVIILLLVAVLFYSYITYFTRHGKECQLLARNQKVAVNSGVNENKNIILSYLVTGFILGLGACAYVAQNQVNPQSSLSTSGILFSYIVPVYVGLFVGSASCDVVGIVITAFGLSFMNYGLNVMGVGAGGVNQIIQGLFMLFIYAIQSQMDKIIMLVNHVKAKFRKNSVVEGK